MYAIVDIAGQQFRVEKGQKIFVHRLSNPEGELVDFDQVLLIDNEGKISIGEPLVEGAFIEGKVLTHVKGDKVIVFKKKRRKGYQKRNGHRQSFSQLEILAINEKGAPKKGAKPAVKVEKEEAEVVSEVKAAPEKVAAPKAKATVAKAESEVKKPAAKKPAAKKPVEKKAPATKAAAEKKSSGATAAKGSAKPKAAPKKDKPAGKAE